MRVKRYSTLRVWEKLKEKKWKIFLLTTRIILFDSSSQPSNWLILSLALPQVPRDLLCGYGYNICPVGFYLLTVMSLYIRLAATPPCLPTVLDGSLNSQSGASSGFCLVHPLCVGRLYLVFCHKCIRYCYASPRLWPLTVPESLCSL